MKKQKGNFLAQSIGYLAYICHLEINELYNFLRNIVHYLFYYYN